MQTNIYFRIRRKGKELVRINIGVLIVGAILGAIIGALCFCSAGCAYRVIPEKAAAKVESVPPALRKQATAAQTRSEGHRAKAEAIRAAAGGPERMAEVEALLLASSEAEHGAKVENAAAGAVEDGMGQSQPAGQFIAEQVGPVIKPVLAVATVASGGVPWDAIVQVALGALGLGGTVWGCKRHLDAKSSDRVNDFEEALAADPDPETGGVGSIAYDSPKVKARTLDAKSKNRLTAKDVKKMYPNGIN
jgi:hypothetical protein